MLQLTSIETRSSFFERGIYIDRGSNRMIRRYEYATEPWYWNNWPGPYLWWIAAEEKPNVPQVTLDIKIDPLTGLMGGVRASLHRMLIQNWKIILPLNRERYFGIPIFNVTQWPKEAQVLESYRSDDSAEVKREKDLSKRVTEQYEVDITWASDTELVLFFDSTIEHVQMEVVVNPQLSLLFTNEQALAGLCMHFLPNDFFLRS